MSYKSQLTQRCTVTRITVTHVNGLNSRTVSTTENVRCLVQERLGGIYQDEGGRTLRYDAIAFFLPSADIRPQGSDESGDSMELTSNGQGAYDIVHVSDPSGKNKTREALLVRRAKT